MKKYQLWMLIIPLIVVAAATTVALMVYFGFLPDRIFILSGSSNQDVVTEYTEADDPWWDTWELGETYRLRPGPKGINPGNVYFVCTGIDSFEYYNNGTVYMDASFVDIYKDAERIGCVVPGIHDPENGCYYWT